MAAIVRHAATSIKELPSHARNSSLTPTHSGMPIGGRHELATRFWMALAQRHQIARPEIAVRQICAGFHRHPHLGKGTCKFDRFVWKIYNTLRQALRATDLSTMSLLHHLLTCHHGVSTNWIFCQHPLLYHPWVNKAVTAPHIQVAAIKKELII